MSLRAAAELTRADSGGFETSSKFKPLRKYFDLIRIEATQSDLNQFKPHQAVRIEPIRLGAIEMRQLAQIRVESNRAYSDRFERIPAESTLFVQIPARSGRFDLLRIRFEPDFRADSSRLEPIDTVSSPFGDSSRYGCIRLAAEPKNSRFGPNRIDPSGLRADSSHVDSSWVDWC